MTVINWFLYGMVDEEFDWFIPGEARPITFENRMDQIMLPMMKAGGLRNPDLIVEVSLIELCKSSEGLIHIPP